MHTQNDNHNPCACALRVNKREGKREGGGEREGEREREIKVTSKNFIVK